MTDENIQTFINGGVDSLGIIWPGRDLDLSFSQDMGRQLTGIDNYQCSLESPCKHDLICSDIGSRTAYEGGREVWQSRPAFFFITALENINQQLSNQNVALKGALARLALDTFNIGDFFPKPEQGFGLINALSGLGTVFSILSGFVPVVGPGLAAAGTILPAVGSFVGNSIAARTDVNVGPKTFAPKVIEVYDSILSALEEATDTLLNGGRVNDAFNITDMMAGGAWVDSSALTRVTDHLKACL